MTGEPILLFERTGKTYGSSPPVHALREVSIRVEAGTFCLLEGPSGSGKTTLLAVAGGLEPPTRGRVRVLGVDLGDASPRELREIRRRAVGFVFQDFKLIGALTALENVALALRLRGVRRGRARAEGSALLERLGLADRIRHRPAGLSGGEQQRVAIARALVSRPRLVLADEPTANLDTVAGANAVGLLRELASEQGATVVLASHDGRLARYADRVVRLVDGTVATEDAPEGDEDE